MERVKRRLNKGEGRENLYTYYILMLSATERGRYHTQYKEDIFVVL